MNEEVLWKTVENHFYACEGGYQRGSVYRIPWDRQAWLLAFSIGSSRYRAVIVKHNRAHIYILKCVAEPDDDLNIPENWFTDWDEAIALKEFGGRNIHETDD